MQQAWIARCKFWQQCCKQERSWEASEAASSYGASVHRRLAVFVSETPQYACASCQGMIESPARDRVSCCAWLYIPVQICNALPRLSSFVCVKSGPPQLLSEDYTQTAAASPKNDMPNSRSVCHDEDRPTQRNDRHIPLRLLCDGLVWSVCEAGGRKMGMMGHHGMSFLKPHQDIMLLACTQNQQVYSRPSQHMLSLASSGFSHQFEIPSTATS